MFSFLEMYFKFINFFFRIKKWNYTSWAFRPNFVTEFFSVLITDDESLLAIIGKQV